MDTEQRRRRTRSFILGSLLGASAVLAAGRRGRRRKRPPSVGLEAFEGAPCYAETLEREGGSPPTP
jgi:hypothetical protein